MPDDFDTDEDITSASELLADDAAGDVNDLPLDDAEPEDD